MTEKLLCDTEGKQALTSELPIIRDLTFGPVHALFSGKWTFTIHLVMVKQNGGYVTSTTEKVVNRQMYETSYFLYFLLNVSI